MKDTYYFPHDYNARNDLKIQAMVDDYGAVGYGIYWAVIEMLHEEDENRLPFNKVTFKSIAKQMSTSVEQVEAIVNCCLDYELFIFNDELFYSERVNKNINKRTEIAEKRSIAGKMSAQKRAESLTIPTNVEQVLTSVQQNPTKKRKEKESKVNESKGNKVFTIPTLSEISDYCKERKNAVDPIKYFNHYESNGWMVGKNKMKNWKAAVHTWEKNNIIPFNNQAAPNNPHKLPLYQ